MKIFYNLLRRDMIKRMLKAGWKEQRINTVLSALGLPEIAKEKKLPKNKTTLIKEAKIDIDAYLKSSDYLPEIFS